MIAKAETLFNLSVEESGGLASSAGIWLTEEDIPFYETVGNCYKGTIRELCYKLAVD
ncbi:MAG: hypothetical protein K2K04_03330 [Clostridia bacterium]|nr:hypothetical protein [Clostridia bacterium]